MVFNAMPWPLYARERDLVPIEESYYTDKMFYYQFLPPVENMYVVPSTCDLVSMKAPLARFS